VVTAHTKFNQNQTICEKAYTDGHDPRVILVNARFVTLIGYSWCRLDSLLKR